MADTMNWNWIAAALVLPFLVGVLIAWPFWGRSRDSIGSAIGAIAIFAFAVGFIAREYAHLQFFTQGCIASETPCSFHPEPFTRFSIYGFIAMTQVGALFAMSAAIEHRLENARFANEWRR